MEWLKGFIIPLIKIVFIGGIFGFIFYFVGKAFHNAWSKQIKFFIKHKILRRKYPETSVKWILNCIDKGIGYYNAKKILMVNMVEQNRMNEILWIYDQIINEMKGGQTNNGRQFEGSNSKTKSQTNLPSI